MTEETTSMAGEPDDTRTVSEADWQAFQAYQAATAQGAARPMEPATPESVAAYDRPSAAAQTEASGQVPDQLPIPVAQAPMPTDTDALIRQLMSRIQSLETKAQQAAAAAGIPANPVEAAMLNLSDHVIARANANPTLEPLRELAKTVKTTYEDVKAG